jgi:bifunctional isochorismate lyase/aryl carrier protein
MRADIAAVLGVPEDAVRDDQPLVEQGLDSIRLMAIAERWRAAGIRVSYAALAHRPTLRDWDQMFAAKNSLH